MIFNRLKRLKRNALHISHMKGSCVLTETFVMPATLIKAAECTEINSIKTFSCQ